MGAAPHKTGQMMSSVYLILTKQRQSGSEVNPGNGSSIRRHRDCPIFLKTEAD